MRISTAMIYDKGLGSIQQRTGSLLQTQQQISSNRRMLKPSDDPVAAARALEVSQSLGINASYAKARTSAKHSLGMADVQLHSASDVLARVRELAVQGANATLSTADRKSIATELRARFDELIALANSTDGAGNYLFSGYRTDSKPFAGSVEDGVVYSGDSGKRSQMVSSSRDLPISYAGNEIFMGGKAGNGVFVTATQDQKSTLAVSALTPVIDKGTVTDPVKWSNSANSGNHEIRFWVDAANEMGGGVNAIYYDLVDATTGKSLYTDNPSATGAAGSYTHAYTSGAAITFSGLDAAYNPPSNDFGASVTITGTPADGDTFTIVNSTAATGNGYFQTAPKVATRLNAGGGTIDGGQVLDQSKWNNPGNSGNLEIRFWEDTSATPAVLYYDLVDATTQKSLFTNTKSIAGGVGNTYTHSFTAGNSIPFSGLNVPDPTTPSLIYTDFGVAATISGTPQSGDVFTLKSSPSQSIFDTVAELVTTLEMGNPVGTSGNVQVSNQVGAVLQNLSQAEDAILRVRANIGTGLTEIDALDSAGESLDLQYQEALSNLQDVDMAKAITDLTRQQVELQAAQMSFMKVSSMSLFDYLR